MIGTYCDYCISYPITTQKRCSSWIWCAQSLWKNKLFCYAFLNKTKEMVSCIKVMIKVNIAVKRNLMPRDIILRNHVREYVSVWLQSISSLWSLSRSNHRRCFSQKCRKFHRKTPAWQSPTETPTQVFSCEIWEIFKNTYLKEHLRTTVLT